MSETWIVSYDNATFEDFKELYSKQLKLSNGNIDELIKKMGETNKNK